MTRNLTNKRAIVTGASSGIGRAIAKKLVQAGTNVLACSRNTERLQSLAGEVGNAPGELTLVHCDLTDPADRENLIRSAQDLLGGLDLLINNAGQGSWGHFASSTEEINRAIMEVNFFAPIELTRLAVPLLKFGQQPAVVNVTSMCGRKAMPAWPEYSASKYALVGMSEAWRGEFVRFGIDVLTIVPGLTKTGLNEHLLRKDGRADLPFENGMEPDQVADRTLEAIRRSRTETTLGGEAKKILFLNKWFPRLLDRLIARKVRKLYS